MEGLRASVAARLDRRIGRLGCRARPWLDGVWDQDHAGPGPAYTASTGRHGLRLLVRGSALPGTYLHGRAVIEDSWLQECDLRGDELKDAGDRLAGGGRLAADEVMRVSGSVLVNCLLHCDSRDPGHPEAMVVRSTVGLPWANIHGASLDGVLLGTLATVDLTTAVNSVLEPYAYVQTGRLEGRRVAAGTVWIAAPAAGFEFRFQWDPARLAPYLEHQPGRPRRAGCWIWPGPGAIWCAAALPGDRPSPATGWPAEALSAPWPCWPGATAWGATCSWPSAPWCKTPAWATAPTCKRTAPWSARTWPAGTSPPTGP